MGNKLRVRVGRLYVEAEGALAVALVFGAALAAVLWWV